MPNVIERIRQFWRDQIAGPTLPTYDAACEQLGGEPWLMKPDKTDRWFIGGQPETRRTPPEPLPALDTAAIKLTRTMSERTKLLLVGGMALAVIIACVVSLAGGTTGHPATVATTPPAPPPAAAPATPAPPTTPRVSLAAAMPRPAPRSSSSVRALFADDARAHATAGKRHLVERRRRR
jgi:hypothetical protein